MELKTENIDTLNLIRKRMQILVGSRLRETNRTKEAMQIQDRIRTKVGKWEGSKEIKKWRAKR